MINQIKIKYSHPRHYPLWEVYLDHGDNEYNIGYIFPEVLLNQDYFEKALDGVCHEIK